MNQAHPYRVDGETSPGTELHPLSHQDKTFSEVWLQELLYRHPLVLPVGELDEAFAPPVPIGREIANIDNLFISPQGLLTVVETKLWRNPEAHRTVVAQVLDYARTLATWSYATLDQAVRTFMQSRHSQSRSLYQTVQGGVKHFGTDEIEFQQKVQDGLSGGKFALLIVGDRIYPGATQLAEMIESAPHLQFTIGFVELRCYRLDKTATWPLVVVPHFVTKTKEITRAVVKVLYEEKKPEVEVLTPSEHSTSGGRTTRDEFIALLPSTISDMFTSFIDRWLKAGYTIYWGTAGFSLRVIWKNKIHTIFDAYPTYASILQEKRAKKEGFPDEYHQTYKAELMSSPSISNAYALGKRYVYFAKLTPEDVLLLLNSTDTLTKAVAGEG